MSFGKSKLILLCIYACIIVAVQSSKLEKLQSLSKSGVLNLSDNDFTDLIETGPRDYDVIMFVTSTGTKFSCAYCPHVQEQMDTLASWYNSGVSTAQRKIFFVTLDFDRNIKIIREYQTQIQALPFLARIPPTTSKKVELKWGESDAIHFHAIKFDPTAANLAEHFNELIGTDKIKAPPPSMTTFYVTTAVVAVVGTILLLWLQRNMRNPMLWFGVFLTVVLGVYGGTVWNLNHSPPWSIVQGGQVTYIYPSRDFQTLSESILISVLTVVEGLLFVLFTEWVPTRVSRLRRFAAFMLVLTLFTGVFLVICSIFLRKTPWYFKWSQ